MPNAAPLLLIGYSGHAYVAAAAHLSGGGKLVGYCDREDKGPGPYALPFLGDERGTRARAVLEEAAYLIAIGDNRLRRRIAAGLGAFTAATVLHPTAVADPSASISAGTLLAPLAVVNPLARVGKHCIINTRATVEHECRVADFVHVAPGATLLGNVSVGRGSLIGANAVVLPGLTIGADCTIGAGAVVTHDVPDGTTVVGSPARPR